MRFKVQQFLMLKKKSKRINHRLEKDFLGLKAIPKLALYGINTVRAVENFPISRSQIGHYPDFISAIAIIKKSATEANSELGLITLEKSTAIIHACEDIIQGNHHDQFIVSVLQGGAGTSTNMNANEVIANLALVHLGKECGDYDAINPNDDVNLSQSTNDVYPSAIRLGLLLAIPRLINEMSLLAESFDKKAIIFDGILKIGRTQLQEAVPMSLGQEMHTHAVMLKNNEQRLKNVIQLLKVFNLGATAIGTGINTHPDYREKIARKINAITNLDIQISNELITATQDCSDFVELSGVLKRVAISISKSCNDLRLLSSGPRSGFREINLPPKQPGSSIMPGKVNPVIPELVNQVAYEVIGNDTTIAFAAEGGQLQLNAFEPVIAWSLFKSIYHLENAMKTLRINCIDGITANKEWLASELKHSTGIATALLPHIGYEKSAAIARESLKTGLDVASIAVNLKLAKKSEIKEWLNPNHLINPNITPAENMD
jgi:aspartate ammonia-lyase